MPRPTTVGEQRVAGSLLVIGFAFLVLAAFLYGFATYPWGETWQHNVLSIGLVLTLFGLSVFQLVLIDAGDRLLARLGTIAFLVGVVMWLVGEAIALDSGRFIFEFERDYVVLACVAIAAFGGAVVKTTILPRWVGVTAMAWAVVWGILYLARVAEAPLGPNLITGLFGLELLVHRPDRSAADHL